jgi:DNA-binding winged helix-turn-helix (wHTH) protein/GNAT superfamily N-acetyltransferase
VGGEPTGGAPQCPEGTIRIFGRGEEQIWFTTDVSPGPVAAMLGVLAVRAGEVVSKDEIIERVWQARFLSDSVLTRTMSELRHVLGDISDLPRIIETIGKHGYRLIATVERLGRPGQPRLAVGLAEEPCGGPAAHFVTFDVRVTMTNMRSAIQTKPLTPERWQDVVVVFGNGRGVCSQCWCMYWRLPRKVFERSLREGNRKLFQQRVDAGPPPGLLAYVDGEPVGWVQVGPRADVPGWNGSRRLTAPTPDAPAADPGVWGISCFAIRAGRRRQGIATALLDGAIEWARENGARILDACPVDASEKRPPTSLYHGIGSMFLRAGFREVTRRRRDRPLMRLHLDA